MSWIASLPSSSCSWKPSTKPCRPPSRCDTALGRPGARAEVHPAGRQRRRQTLAVSLLRPVGRSRAPAAEAPATAATHATNRDLTTPRDAKGRTHGPGVGARVPGLWWRHPTHHIHQRSGADPEDPGTPAASYGVANRSSPRPSLPPEARRPTGENSCRSTFDRASFQATDRRAARDRHPQPLTAFHATVRTAQRFQGRCGSRPCAKRFAVTTVTLEDDAEAAMTSPDPPST